LKETFDSIYYYRDPVTGIYTNDPSDFRSRSGCEDVGLVFGCIAIAGKIGLISDDTAKRELSKALYYIEQIPAYPVFPHSTVTAHDPTAIDKNWTAMADIGSYPCG